MTYKLVKAGDKMSLYDKANETAKYLKSKKKILKQKKKKKKKTVIFARNIILNNT